MKKLIILSITLLILCQHKSALGDQVESKLVHDIFSNYESSVRPSDNNKYPVNVTFSMSLVQIVEVSWKDPKLQWNPSLYDQIDSISIPSETIWKPDIVLTNNVNPLARFSSTNTNAVIYNNGDVLWISPAILKTSCVQNSTVTAFKEISCDLGFLSWTFHGFLLDLKLAERDTITSDYRKHREWTLDKATVKRNVLYYSCCKEPYPSIDYKLILRKNST